MLLSRFFWTDYLTGTEYVQGESAGEGAGREKELLGFNILHHNK
jgi:hypothetical protein